MDNNRNWEHMHHIRKRGRKIVYLRGKKTGETLQHGKPRPDIVLIFHLILMLLLLPVPSSASMCEDSPLSPTIWESLPKHEGYYFNCSNGYAITIPEGFAGRSSPMPHPQHGFRILLSRHPYRYISVDGSANVADMQVYEQAVEWYADVYVESIQKDAEVVSVQKFPSQLGTLPALRLTVRYACPDADLKMREYILAVDQRGYAYTINLSTDDATYEEDKPILEQLAGTFRLIDNSCTSACEIYWPDDESSLAAFEGDYVSCHFGYALTIPTGFVGRINSLLADSGLGFDILLSQQPRGVIKVDLSSNEPGWHSPDEVTEEDLAWLKSITKQILSVQKEALTLAGLPAIRFIVRYVCSDDTIVVKDTFFVLHQERELVYKMWLLADDARYEEYKLILEQLVKTFQLRETSCE